MDRERRATRTPRQSRTRQGQVWSLDYTIGMLLFIITLLLATSVLVRTYLGDGGFAELQMNAEALSTQLLGTGYPADWRADDVISIGLVTDDHLSAQKVMRFAQLAQQSYEGTKNLLNTHDEYAVLFLAPNGTIVAFGTSCRIGSDGMTEQKTVSEERQRVAYYGTGAQALKPIILSLNGTVYTDLSALLANLSTVSYDLLVLEEPKLSATTPPYDGEKQTAIEDFVADGGDLLLIGNVSLSLFSMNLTLLNTSTDAAGSPLDDDLLNLSSVTWQGLTIPAYALKGGGLRRYTNLSVLPDDRAVAARFTYGDGTVRYLSGLSGAINETGEDVLSIVERGLNSTTLVQHATCLGVEPDPDATQYVTVRRLVAHNGRILIMRVDEWKR